MTGEVSESKRVSRLLRWFYRLLRFVVTGARRYQWILLHQRNGKEMPSGVLVRLDRCGAGISNVSLFSFLFCFVCEKTHIGEDIQN